MRPHRTHAPPRRPRWRAAVVSSAAAALTGAWISGCSVLYDLSTEQCSTDADCTALGGDFVGLACLNHLCQEPPGCRTHAECIDDEGNGNLPYACVDRACQPLLTAECPSILPLGTSGELWRDNLRSTNPLIVAGTGVVTGANPLDVRLRNYDLALTELTTTADGIGTPKRKLVMLGCKAAPADNAELDRMMTHLAQTIKVPAFISAMFAANLQYAFENYGQPANMFFLSAVESDPLLATLSDGGRLWHIGGRPEALARVTAPLLTRTIDYLTTQTGVTGPIRVATVVADLRMAANMITTVSGAPENSGLRFNDQSVADNLRNEPPTYRGLTVAYGDPAPTTAIQQLLEFQPHVIISLAGPEFFRIIRGVEQSWNTGSGQPRPFYLLSLFNYNDQDSLDATLGANPTLRTRLAGVNPAAAENSANYDRYFTAYQGRYGLNDSGFENFYDAAYYLMYAAAAVVGESDLRTGEDFPRGMRRLMDGPAYDVGVNIPQALQALAIGNIQLNGTMGPPIWNSNGTRDLPGSVYCIDTAGRFKADVLRYSEAIDDDASSVSLSGDFTCIPNF